MKILYRAAAGALEKLCGLGHFPILNEQARCAGAHLGDGVELYRRMAMLDVIMLATGLGFFALLVGYGLVCDGL